MWIELRRLGRVRALLAALTALGLAGAGTPAAQAADNCPNAQIRAKQNAAQLPDCRAYELVSPGNTATALGNNANPTIEMAASPDGNRASYVTFLPLPGSETGTSGVLSERVGDEWSTLSLLGPPSANQWGNGFPGYDAQLLGSTPDQRTAAYFDLTTEPNPSLWVRRADGTRVRIADSSRSANLVLVPTALAGWAPGMPAFQGISADGKHVVFVSRDALVAGITPASDPSCQSIVQPTTDTRCEILYEWVDDGSNGGKGTVRVVNVTNGPTPTLVGGGAPASLGGSPLRTLTNNIYGYGRHNAISADGSRIYFQAAAPAALVGGFGGHPQGGGPVYLREDGEHTTEISAPEPGHTPDSPPTRYQYMTATPDGSLAFFWADGDLTADAPSAGGIYRWDAEEDELSFVAEASLVSHEGNQLLPTALVSDDGSHLYFQDGNTLRVASGGSVREVASQVARSATALGADGGFGTTPGITSMGCPSADVSPDGRYFTFMGRVTPDSAALGDQVFRYDSQTEELEHISKSTAIDPPPDPTTYSAGFPWVGACEPLGAVSRPIEARLMSDDGSRVFFVTAEALVPGDNNEKADVYQWHEGEVSLISTGTSLGGATGPGLGELLMGSDADGETVFFATKQALVWADTNTEWSLYAARANGGLPSQNQTPKPPCQGDECQGGPTPQPPDPEVGSGSYQGQGNPASQASARSCAAAKKRLARAKAALRKARRTAARTSRASSKATNARRKARRAVKRARRQLRACRRGGK